MLPVVTASGSDFMLGEVMKKPVGQCSEAMPIDEVAGIFEVFFLKW
jgi:hypothetical protein